MDSTYGPSYSKYGLTLPAGGYYQPPTYGRTLSTHGKFSGRQSTLLWQVPPPPSSVKSRGKICSITLAAASFVVLISVLAIAGLALYMGAVHSSPEPFVTFRGSAKVARGDRFIGNVQEKARRYSMQFEALYKKSNLGPAVVSSSVDRFGNDTYTVYFKIVLDKRKLPKTLVNVEKALKDILVTDPLSRKPTFGKIRFDSRSITFSASSADESYQRNSPPLKETPLTRNRVLLKPNNRLNLTTVRTTSTTKSPIKEIEINEETLPMIQGSFKISKTEADITENKKTAPKLFEMKTTTPSPKPKPTVKETAITSTLFKIAQSTTTTTSTPTTTKETPTTTKTTPTTPSTTTAASTTSTSTSTLTSTSTSSSYFDQEPWIPIIDHKQQQFYNFFPHNNKNKQSFYTSFTNPDLSYTGGSAEILGATMPQRHPLPVNKLADVPDDSRWETSTMQVNYNINIKHEKFGNNNNNNNNNDKIIVVSSTTSTTTSPPNTQSSTLSIDDQSEKIKEKINALDYKTRQDAILKNVSTIFHGLLSSLGIESSFNSNNQQTIQHQQQLPKVQDQQKLDVNKNQNLNQSLEEKLETPVLNEQPTQSNLTLKLKLNETNQHSLDNPGKQTTIVELTDSNKKEEIVYEKVTLTPTKGPRVDDEITKGPVFDEKLKRKGEEIAFEELSRQGSDSLPSLPILQETDKVIETEEVIGEGQVEVVNEDSIFIPEHTTKQSLVTLLPAKSNSGVGKPLRPRPKIPGRSNSTIPVIAENRSFPSDSSYKNLNTNFDLKENKEFTISSLHSSGIPGVAIVENSEEIMNVNGENDKKKNTNFNIVGVLNFQPGPEASVFQDDVSKNGIIRVPKMEEPGINQTDIKIKINNKDEEDDDDNDEDEISVFSTSSSVSLSIHRPLTPEKIKQLAEISKISENFTDGREISNNKLYNYTMSNGFKVLTKNFNKVEVVKTLDKPVKLGCNKTDCSGFTVRCGDGKLFPETTRCNQLVDCADGSDEQNCTCADYLRSQFLLRKICDGIVDCWDFSDENNCEWCKPGQYVCGNSKVCIDHNQICDGNKDCPHGDDERLCVTIAPAIEEAEGFSYYSEGYLMVQRKGKWGKLCADNFQDPAPAWNVAELGRVVCKSMTYRTLTRTETVLEEQVGQRSQYYQLERVNGTNSELAFEETACETAKVVKVKCKTLECGARPQAVDQVARRSYRIVGGGNAGLGAWPWQAAIYKEGEFQCGGTLISDQWLLSAGHCFYHSLEDHWVARLGALRRGTSLPSPYEQLRIITNIILHPNYNDVGFVNDISLLKMEKPIAFSDYVRPICLPPADSKLKDGRVCTVIGWGQLFEVGRIFPDTLQEVQVPVISTAECRKMTIFMPLYKVTDDMFCAGFERGGRDACLGDSGGPLMCPEDDGQWVLQGITSNGYGCARANRPGVYTKVSNYIPWIETLLYDNSANTTHHQRSPKPCNGHRCPLGECLPKSSVCNGFIECNDGSDEKDCLINN